jgi:hypothetical protein
MENGRSVSVQIRHSLRDVERDGQAFVPRKRRMFVVQNVKQRPARHALCYDTQIRMLQTQRQEQSQILVTQSVTSQVEQETAETRGGPVSPSGTAARATEGAVRSVPAHHICLLTELFDNVGRDFACVDLLHSDLRAAAHDHRRRGRE